MSDPDFVLPLVAAILLAPLAGGRWNVPAAAWLLPGFLLAAGHETGTAQAYLVALAVLTAGGLVSLAGQVPLPLPAYLLMVLPAQAVVALAFLADRIVTGEVDWFAATLAFPITVVVLELASAASSPFGSWGTLAHSQDGNLPLNQLAAVGGGAAVTFLVSWFGSTLAWAWSHGFEPDLVGAGMAAYCTVLAAVLLAGGVRLARSRAPAGTVRVVSLAEPAPADPGVLSTQDAFGLLMRDTDLTDDEWSALRRTARAVQRGLLDATARAASGAGIVLWAEGAGLVTATDEAGFVEQGCALAREHGYYLAMALAVAHQAGPRHLENKVVMVTPAGQVGFEYHKRRPVPGVEQAHSLPGDAPLRWLDTPYGRLGVLICFDIDIPRLARQIGAAGLDILLVPASDWPAIARSHSALAALRSIEYGVSVVRSARWGRSLATDPLGRILAALDHQPGTPQPAMTAHVPTSGVPTLPSLITARSARPAPPTTP